MAFEYGRPDLDETEGSDLGLSRRSMLKQGAAAVVGGGAALLGGAPLGAQAGNAALAAAEAEVQKPGPTAGKKFRALVRNDKSLSVETLTLRRFHPQQVVVRTQASQTCYTMTADLNTAVPAIPPTPAQIAGHAGVGIVEEVGSQVRRVQVGDRVVVAVTPQCGACGNCLNGRADICQMFGRPRLPSASMADGSPVLMAFGPSGLGEYMVAWEEFVIPVFTKIPATELSLLGCVATAGLGLAMCRFPVDPGSDVAVFGAGPVGLSAIQGARIQGATTIVAIDPVRYRRELALKLGATLAIDPNVDKDNDLLTKVRALTASNVPQGRLFAGGRAQGPMFVLEAVGGTRFPPTVEAPLDPTGVDALQQAWNLVRGDGYVRTCSVGHPRGATVSFPAATWANTSKTHAPGNFAGVHTLRDIPRFVKLIEAKLFDAASLVGPTFPIEKAREALQPPRIVQ